MSGVVVGRASLFLVLVLEASGALRLLAPETTYALPPTGNAKKGEYALPPTKADMEKGGDAVDQVGGRVTEATEDLANDLPRVPEAPLPSVAVPIKGGVPVVGSSKPHTANPVVCGLLGGVIVLNWVLACCCAGVGAAGAGAAAVEAEKGDTADAEKASVAGGLTGVAFGCVECAASLCSIMALVYAFFTGLFQAWMGGQAVSGWCLAMAIISTLQLLACMCICCCATCGMAILGPVAYDKYVNKHSKHVFGTHMHQMVHKHKPDGTHPLHEGHLPVVGGRVWGEDKATEATPNQ